MSTPVQPATPLFYLNSSFYIATTLCVPHEARDEFNTWVAEHGTSDTADLPAYYDRPYENPFLKPADIKPTMTSHPLQNDWWVKNDGALVTRLKHCHGAMTALHWCIQEFFAPRGILLNGYVIGVNDEFGMLYVYYLRDNLIHFDPITDEFVPQYQQLWIEDDDDGMCKEMMSWILTNLGLNQARAFGKIRWYDAEDMADILYCIMGQNYRDEIDG
jgi:hypothetical protein